MSALGLQGAFRIRQGGGTSAVEYSRYTGTQGAAAVQAGEGAAKAAMRVDHDLVVQSAVTVAGYSKISRQALNDRAELAAAVNIGLQRSVAAALDTMLRAAPVTPVFAGMIALASPVTSVLYIPLVDAISEAVAGMQAAGFNPDVVVLAPSDWLAIVTAKAAVDGHYLSGSYLSPLASTIRGLRVVLSPGITATKALVIDSSQLELVAVENFAVEIGYPDDDFLKNVATLRGEARFVPIYRAVGGAVLVTPDTV